MMKGSKRIFFIMILIAAALCTSAYGFSHMAEVSAAGGGSFVLTAVDREGFVIEPVRVNYSEGDTVADALKGSGHSFDGIDEGWITSIDGKTDNYVIFYDGGKYDLEGACSEVETGIVFTTVENAYCSEYLNLTKELADYSSRPQEMRDFPAVDSGWKGAVAGLPSADKTKAKELYSTLLRAYSQWEEWNTAVKTTVTIKPVQQGAAVDAKVEIEDESGNTYEMEGTTNQFQLREGEYSYQVSKGNNSVSGSFQVNEGNEITINPQLPYGNWVEKVELLKSDGSPYKSTTTGEGTTVEMEDTCISPYIFVKAGSDISQSTGYENSYSVYSEHTSFGFNKYYGNESLQGNRIPWESRSKSLVRVCEAGAVDKDIKIKVVHSLEDGSVQRQYHDIHIKKYPTLKEEGIVVREGEGELNTSPDFDSGNREYSVDVLGDEISISATSYDAEAAAIQRCGTYEEGYRIKIDGHPQEEGGSVDLTLAQPQSQIDISVTGSNGMESIYKLEVNKVDSGRVKVTRENGVGIVLKNSRNSIIRPVSESDTASEFLVVPGNYTWISTIDEYYHAEGSLTVKKNECTEVNGITPRKESILSQLSFRSGSWGKALEYEFLGEDAFDPQKHEYTCVVPDIGTVFYVKAGKLSAEGTVTADYGKTTIVGSGSAEGGKALPRFIKRGDKGNKVVIRASREVNGTTHYSEYKIKVVRSATLSKLEVRDRNNSVLSFIDENENVIFFDDEEKNYRVKINQDADSAKINFGFIEGDVNETGKYTAAIADQEFQKTQTGDGIQEETATIPMDSSKSRETVDVAISTDREENIPQVYSIEFVKVPPVKVRFNLLQKEGNIYLTSDLSGQRVWPEEDGSYTLMGGGSYTYTATVYGYEGVKETIRPNRDCTIDVNLNKAADNPTIDPDVEAQWPYFRADENNNGVVDAPVPTSAEKTMLYWAAQIGEGYSGNATGCPILADGYLYTYAGNYLMKIDTMTGCVVKKAEMAGASSFAINSPTYAKGMIFVGLSNGTVQAFNSKTLESLWIYRDRLGGQPNCPISYKDGYIYTGFWNSEIKNASLVCLSITDEDPSREMEEKLPTWVHEDKGFYWAGSYPSDKYVIVGTDDGAAGYTNGSGDLLSISPKTGEIIDRISDTFKGDIRSSICYDSEKNRCYFTTKGGYFCSVDVNEDGCFDRESVTTLYLDKGGETSGRVPMSTSTPVIYNNRAYVGVSGTGQFTAYSGHNITVIDLAGDRPEIAYSVATQGYPQTSGLLTTAYDKGDGTVYVYFFDNYTPGKLRVLMDRPGQTKALLTGEETYTEYGNDKTIETAATLFTPFGDQAQYAICSPIADEWGNIYFKNDSAYMMMIGATISDLEVKRPPSKREYIKGEHFDPEGMTVAATMANGKIRDVSNYVGYTKDPLTMDDTEIDIWLDLGENMKLYQDRAGQPGSNVMCPQTSTTVVIKDHAHRWLTKTVKPQFCKNGKKYQQCEICGQTKDEKVIPGLGPANTKITKLSKGKKSFTVKWKKPSSSNLKKTTGYQIRYSRYSSMKSGKILTITKNKTTSKKVTKLQSKKKYYVQIRTYKSVGSSKYYSSWSKAKSITTK